MIVISQLEPSTRIVSQRLIRLRRKLVQRGAVAGDRTPDLVLTMDALYQLSYDGARRIVQCGGIIAEISPFGKGSMCYTNSKIEDMKEDLGSKHCVPCEGGVSPLSEGEIRAYQLQLETPWEVVEGKKIRRQFSFKDFEAAMKFVNKVADLAEAEGHHPDFLIHYNKVTLELWTHAIGGLSENDFILARKIETL